MALLRRVRGSLSRQARGVWAHAVLSRVMRPKATQRVFAHGDDLFIEITLHTEVIPERIFVEGKEVLVTRVDHPDQVEYPYRGGIQAYGAGFLSGVVVYAMVSMNDYCRAIFLTM